MWRQTIDFGVYLAVRLVVAVVQALPLEICERGADLLAALVGRVLGIRRRVVEENIRIAFPNLSPDEREAICARNVAALVPDDSRNRPHAAQGA